VTIPNEQVQLSLSLSLYNYLRLKDYWAGAFQDHKAPDFKEPAGGWYWVTGEPMKFTSWNPNEPNNSEADSEVLQFWGEGSTWNDQNLSAKNARIRGGVPHSGRKQGTANSRTTECAGR
jgi:hypothetical protein